MMPKRTRLKRGSSKPRATRMTKVPSIESMKVMAKKMIESGEYPGLEPTRNVDDWAETFAGEVDNKMKTDKVSFKDAWESVKHNSSWIVEDAESEPEATVIYSYDKEMPARISQYRDDTHGDFETKWVSTDAWRGYYEVESKDWKKIHTDTALAYSQDEAELKKFDDSLMQTLDKLGVKYARVFSRTSNVFSTGYDFFVKKEDASRVEGVVKLLALKYRDPARFQFTALTGKDPSQATEDDRMFVSLAGDILAGRKTFEQVKSEITKKKRVV